MPIKNYTTEIDVYRSVGEIQGALAAHGVSKIVVDYEDSSPRGITFAIPTPRGMLGFKLPANVDGVRAVFARQKVRAADGQAERTAWRNVRDWVMAQIALIEAGMVQLDEVFLPYLVDNSGTTLFEAYQNGRLTLGNGNGNVS